AVDRDADGELGRVGLGAAAQNLSTARSAPSREDLSAPERLPSVSRAGRPASEPPSTVRLGGGATLIGSTPEEIQELLLDDSALNRFSRALDAETPRFRLALDPFHLGVTEVTNEQYAVFVRATGHRPPSGWGSPEVIDEARRAFVNEDAEARRAARTGGGQAGGGRAARRRMFDRDAWWSDHWEEAPWEVPEGADREPVLHVDHADAEAYCEWAGLRLPTEFEYQHACRGTSASRYPWGNEWADGRPPAGESETSVADVAGTREGVTFHGIHDLAGNVWEWTASAYTPYPGFEGKSYEVWVEEDGRAVLRPTTPEPRWDAARRVIAGGSFLNSPLASRCTTRRPTDRTQRTNALGFRVAAAVRPGVDVARRIVRDLEESPVVPAHVTYAPDRTVGLDRWWVVDGAAGAPARYQVVAGYEHLLFVPVESIEIEAEDPGERATPLAPRHLGFLSTSVALTDPALPAGVYLLVLAEGLVLLDAGTGAIAGRLSARAETLAEADGESEIDLARPWVRLSLEVPLTGPGRVLRVALDLRPDPGFWEGVWRD
ncbi:MAG: formylglycine-generating enzyme family protein, partial [Planctomycetota bacterium]